MKTYKEFREAANRAQQAAIAIAKKKSGKYDEDGNYSDYHLETDKYNNPPDKDYTKDE